ncbi:hypothetical protein [Algoriphagus sp.]|uniref:hypothetical protein n=1 Tax=Algoriphagus sp. TaxID=1872435 RepID=UPI003F6F7B00
MENNIHIRIYASKGIRIIGYETPSVKASLGQSHVIRQGIAVLGVFPFIFQSTGSGYLPWEDVLEKS